MRCYFLFTVLVFTFLACGKDDKSQAVDSLLGRWVIVETYYEEGDRVEFGTNPTTSFTEKNEGEFIDFQSESSVSYEYSVNGNSYKSENEIWSLETETRKNGFTNSVTYFVSINNDRYEVQFGDGTSDSHVSASEAQIIYNDNLDNIGSYQSYQLTIVKE